MYVDTQYLPSCPLQLLQLYHVCTSSSIIVYYSDIRTFIHKAYNTMFNLYIQPNRAYNIVQVTTMSCEYLTSEALALC